MYKGALRKIRRERASSHSLVAKEEAPLEAGSRVYVRLERNKERGDGGR